MCVIFVTKIFFFSIRLTGFSCDFVGGLLFEMLILNDAFDVSIEPSIVTNLPITRSTSREQISPSLIEIITEKCAF